MVLHRFEEIIDRVKANPVKRRVAVAGAHEKHVLKAVTEAQSMGIVMPLLIGDTDKIHELSKSIGCDISQNKIVGATDPLACGECAVDMIRNGEADFIMKGCVDTKDILKPVVNKENGLNRGRTISHVVIDEIPSVEKLIVTTDGGMILYPTLEEKKDIILNAVEVLHQLGYERPSVAVLCAVEKLNPKMQETVDAVELVRMNKEGIIPGCDVVGPISYDLAMSAEIAEIKGFDCAFCGKFDVLVVPNMVSGNLMNKALVVNGGAIMAGVVMGAAIPIVLTSRGSSVKEKLLSLAVASLIADKEMS